MKRAILVVFFGLAILSVNVFAQASLGTDGVQVIKVPFHDPPPPMFQYVPNQIVVKLSSDILKPSLNDQVGYITTGCPDLDDLNQKYGVKKFVREFPDTSPLQPAEVNTDLRRYYIIEFNSDINAQQIVRAFNNSECVEKAELIGIHPIYESIPNDPRFLTDQWNFYDAEDNDVDATDAWDYETGDATVVLGLLDSGLQYNSSDLGGASPYTQGNVWINWVEYNGTPGVDDDGNGYVDDWIGWDFVNNIYNAWPGEDADTPDNEPTDFNGHGTHVGGIMGAITNNGTMVAGLAGGWNDGSPGPANGVKIMALRIGWSGEYMGQEVGYVRMDFAAQALYYATNHGATAVNCSWGSSNTGGLGAAVDYAIANGVLVVAAAGNDGDSYPDYLGTRTDVINVCATNSSDVKPYWSNYGTWVDVTAPGVDIISTYSYHYNPNYVAWISGTSQAAPHVTGEAGLLKSYADTLTRDQIDALIRTYVDDIDDLNPGYEGLLGSGRINVFKAVDGVVAPSVTVIQPNGGEVLYIGQVYPIIWEAEDNVGIVLTDIDYSVDGGSNWMDIVELDGNPGTYDWTVTGPPSSTCRMRVTCYDAVGLSGTDMSDEDFCPPYKLQVRNFTISGPSGLPGRFALHRNYPNPFNPTTSISFSLPQDAEVKLEVFNIAGQVVTTLVDGPLAAGEHTIEWKADNYATGIYLYRLQADDFVDTKKMLLLK